jgi:hypothetical protein
MNAGAPPEPSSSGGILSWGTHTLLFALAVIVVLGIIVLDALHDGTPPVLTALSSALFGGGLVATPTSS